MFAAASIIAGQTGSRGQRPSPACSTNPGAKAVAEFRQKTVLTGTVQTENNVMRGFTMIRNTHFYFSAAMASALLLSAAPAGAQVLEEITVTAQKREQSLQDVGISVTAFSGEQ